MSPREPETAPDSVEPILGWRVWLLERDGALAAVAAADVVWERGTNEAVCHLPRTSHAAPSQNCVCGFNALHRPPESYLADGSYAVGAIAAWGEVDVYRTGFRAQFACVLGLLDAAEHPRHRRLLAAAARRYAVPLLDAGGLWEHATSHAKPSLETLHPGSRRPEAARPIQPLPFAALPAGFAGRGVDVRGHLAVDHRRRTMRIAPTPSLAALACDRIEPCVGQGEVVEAGAPIMVASAGAATVLSAAPAAGVITAVNEDVRRYEEGAAKGGWLVELRPHAESLDGTAIAWGRRGAEAYRRFVLAAGSDADLLMSCAERPTPPRALLDPDEGIGWLRALAQQLDAAVRADERLGAALRSLDLETSFELDGLERLIVGPPPLGSDRWVRTAPAREAEREGTGSPRLLRIEARPDALAAYWRGEIGLDPDHVSAGDRAGSVGRAPLHLRSGDRGRLLVANSIHSRLFEAAAAALNGLGNPWFKAGEAVADPIHNLEVLAGFEPPGRLGEGAA